MDPPLPADAPAADSRWVHAKGGHYRVVGVAQARGKRVDRVAPAPPGSPSLFAVETADVLQADDGDPLVVYRGADGQLHVRTLADFRARFALIPETPT